MQLSAGCRSRGFPGFRGLYKGRRRMLRLGFAPYSRRLERFQLAASAFRLSASVAGRRLDEGDDLGCNVHFRRLLDALEAG